MHPILFLLLLLIYVSCRNTDNHEQPKRHWESHTATAELTTIFRTVSQGFIFREILHLQKSSLTSVTVPVNVIQLITAQTMSTVCLKKPDPSYILEITTTNLVHYRHLRWTESTLESSLNRASSFTKCLKQRRTRGFYRVSQR